MPPGSKTLSHKVCISPKAVLPSAMLTVIATHNVQAAAETSDFRTIQSTFASFVRSRTRSSARRRLARSPRHILSGMCHFKAGKPAWDESVTRHPMDLSSLNRVLSPSTAEPVCRLSSPP